MCPKLDLTEDKTDDLLTTNSFYHETWFITVRKQDKKTKKSNFNQFFLLPPKKLPIKFLDCPFTTL